MPAKFQSHLQNIGKVPSKSNHLPNISNDPFLKDKLLIKHKINDLKKQQVSHSNLTYSRNINPPNPVNLLRNVRRIATEQSTQEFNKLSKIQQDIMMQIKNIDICLESQRNQQKQKLKTALFGGHIFLNEINQFVVQRFYDCLQIQSEASHAIIDGFEVLKLVTGIDGQPDVVDANIVKKIPSINNRLLDKSIQAIKQYDKKKTNQYEKNYGKQWSLFRRDLSIMYNSPHQQTKKSIISQGQNDSKLTFIKSFKSRNTNESKSTNLFDSKITVNSKVSFVNDLSFIKKSKNTKVSGNESTSIKTEPFQNEQSDNKIIIKLTKKDVRAILTKHKNMISIWIPPASYPQLFGIFSYKIVKIQVPNKIPAQFLYKCKINRYFFYKFGLNTKVFNAILEWVSYEHNLAIESLEITMEKTLYSRIFARLGWILKFWESANKVKACYYGPQREQPSPAKI